MTQPSEMLSVTIDDQAVLHAAYMPFVVNGGLFIPGAGDFRLGDEVFVLLRLMDEPAGIPFAGHVTAAAGLLASLDAGQQTVDHLDGLVETLVAPEHLKSRQASWFGADLLPHVDAAKIDAVVAALKASGAALVPTETLLENVTGPLPQLQAREEYAYLPENLRRSYSGAVAGSQRGFSEESAAAFLGLRKRLTGTAFRAGVPVLLGADSPQRRGHPRTAARIVDIPSAEPTSISARPSRQAVSPSGPSWPEVRSRFPASNCSTRGND